MRPQLNTQNDILSFLNYLEALHIWYRLEHTRDDAITVGIHMPGLRIEVASLKEWVEYSIFSGNERSLDNFSDLFDTLEEGRL